MPSITKQNPFIRSKEKIKISLTKRDEEILLGLYRYRFLDTNLILFLTNSKSLNALQKRLRLLFDGGFIDRPPAQILDWMPQAGTKPTVYALGNAGVQFLKKEHGFGFPAGYQTEKNRRLKDVRFIRHTLKIASFMVGVEKSCLASGKFRFISFDEILATAPEKTRKRKNPASFLVSMLWFGAHEKLNITPDSIFGLEDLTREKGKNKAYFFLEIDNGTEPLTRRNFRQTSILKKFLAYTSAWNSKAHEENFGIKNFRVLTVTTTKQRVNSMIEVFKTKIENTPAGIFLFSDFESVDDDPLNISWLNGKGEEVEI